MGESVYRVWEAAALLITQLLEHQRPYTQQYGYLSFTFSFSFFTCSFFFILYHIFLSFLPLWLLYFKHKFVSINIVFILCFLSLYLFTIFQSFCIFSFFFFYHFLNISFTVCLSVSLQHKKSHNLLLAQYERWVRNLFERWKLGQAIGK